MTGGTGNPRWTMAVVLALALAAGIAISEGLKAVPGTLAGDLVASFVVALAAVSAFLSISLIALVVYAMDRASGRIVHRVAVFDRVLEADRGR